MAVLTAEAGGVVDSIVGVTRLSLDYVAFTLACISAWETAALKEVVQLRVALMNLWLTSILELLQRKVLIISCSALR